MVLATLFISVFRYVYVYQLRQDLIHELGEVVEEHIGIDQAGIFFKKDKAGDTLRLNLFSDSVSALFLDKENKVMRAYGAFESQIKNNKEVENLNTLIANANKIEKVNEENFYWNNIQYLSFITPLKSRGQRVGSVVLAKSLVGLDTMMTNVFVVLAVLGGVGLLGSFFLGYIAINSSFKPILKIVRAFEATDLNRLEKKVHLDGHPDDEFVLLADKFNDMLERLNDMSLRQKEFIGNASHELKTPLTRAITSLDVMMTDRALPKDDLHLIKQDLLEINNLIEKLLLLARIKEGAMPQGSVILQNVLSFVMDKYIDSLHKKRIELHHETSSRFIIPVPKEYAIMIFANLMSNAVKYSSNDSTIYIKINEAKRQITIQDHGIGMTEEEKSKMFERFYRGKKTHNTIKGYGLGLSLIKQICDEYEVKIIVDSKPEDGTSVTLIFPL